VPERATNISTGGLGVGCGGQPKEGALKARQAACPWQQSRLMPLICATRKKLHDRFDPASRVSALCFFWRMRVSPPAALHDFVESL